MEELADDIDKSATLMFDKYMGPTTALKFMARFKKIASLNSDELLQKSETEVIMQNEILTTPNAIVNAPTTRTKEYSMRVHAVGTGIPINQQIIKNPNEIAKNNMFKVVCVHRIVLERTVYILNALLRVPHTVTNPTHKETNYKNLMRLIANGMTTDGWAAANISYVGTQFSNALAPQSIFGMVVDLQSHGLLKDNWPVKNEDQLLTTYNQDWVEPGPMNMGGIQIHTIPPFYASTVPGLNLDVQWDAYTASYVTVPYDAATKKYRVSWPNWNGGAWATDVEVESGEHFMILVPVRLQGTYGIIAYGTQAPVDFAEGADMYKGLVKDANTHMETLEYKVVMGAKVTENNVDNVLVIPCRTVTNVTTLAETPTGKPPKVHNIVLNGTAANDATKWVGIDKTDIVIIHLDMKTAATKAAIKAAYDATLYPDNDIYDLTSLKMPTSLYNPDVRSAFMENKEIDLHSVPQLGFAFSMPVYYENQEALNITLNTAAAMQNAPRPDRMVDCEGPGKTLAFGVKKNYTLMTELPAFDYIRFYNMCASARTL